MGSSHCFSTLLLQIANFPTCFGPLCLLQDFADLAESEPRSTPQLRPADGWKGSRGSLAPENRERCGLASMKPSSRLCWGARRWNSLKRASCVGRGAKLFFCLHLALFFF
ncbi:hypothetical protein VTJ83DRAFT_2578 [Remersonia thermophila]|uniref:Uncharacterized protein n=1 Tax=Remersonia thermophila TaxID=72144 RepID=A0ABR4DK48_9PEZI